MTEKEQRPVNNAEEKAKAFLRLSAVIAALRAPDGCPWDKEQTSYSLAPNFLEEAHELIDAIESGDTEEIKEEAGDVMLHALMQAQLFEEQGVFNSADILNAESENTPLYCEFVSCRIADKAGFRAFIHEAETAVPSVQIRTVPYKSVLVANATLLLIDTTVYFLKRQIENKANRFLHDGGFSERMDRMRRNKRNG